MIELFPSRTVALVVFDVSIYWYGILYVMAFWIAWYLLPRLQRYRRLALSREQWTYLAAWGAAGVIIGGRIGYALFYEPSYFISHPLDIFMLRQGGMSSHGGFLGVLFTLWYASRRLGVSLLAVTDVVVVPAAIGLALGRLGNFINQELYGTLTTMPWGISVPEVEGQRHSAQLYAFAKDCLIAFIGWAHVRHAAQQRIPGSTTAIFLIVYSLLRLAVEFVRVQEWPLVFGLSRGQLYTIPLFMAGVVLWIKVSRRATEATG